VQIIKVLNGPGWSFLSAWSSKMPDKLFPTPILSPIKQYGRPINFSTTSI